MTDKGRSLWQGALIKLNQATHNLRSLPVVVLMPHSRCNCRCVMCDIWKANSNKQELSLEELQRHVQSFVKLKTRWIVFSGGEALLYPSLWPLCEQLKAAGIHLTLLSTGILLERDAEPAARLLDEVIVSLDGPAATHDAIRRVPRAFDKLAAGVAAVKRHGPVRITARSVVQKANWQELAATIETARDLGLDQLSFLAADVSSQAFNRDQPWQPERVDEVALDAHEARRFELLLEEVLEENHDDFESGFIAEAKDKMRDIARHFLANAGLAELRPSPCNAPWVSAVVEADGSVLPCFFHPAYGNLKDRSLEEVLNSQQARQFRRNLDVGSDPICQRCVCRLNL